MILLNHCTLFLLFFNLYATLTTKTYNLYVTFTTKTYNFITILLDHYTGFFFLINEKFFSLRKNSQKIKNSI